MGGAGLSAGPRGESGAGDDWVRESEDGGENTFCTGRCCESMFRRPSLTIVLKSSRSQPTKFSVPRGRGFESGCTEHSELLSWGSLLLMLADTASR